MPNKNKSTRSAARNPYDTYLSWWFKYARNNEMYFDDTKQTSARPLGYTEFQRRYDQMRRAKIFKTLLEWLQWNQERQLNINCAKRGRL